MSFGTKCRTVYNGNECTESQVINVLRTLNRSEMQPFICFLKDRIKEAHDTLETASEPAILYRAQGRVTELKEILETIVAFSRN